MRAGVCAPQQTLSTEAASVLKHSLTLARRRGHAQVTPLHVAATLLSSRTSLLKRACLKSQPNQISHPLQCRALELCFNVALNRLPATPAPFLHAQPSLSNALIAALKRAQAHQRRGCIEQQQQQQQQPIVAVRVELEQLILSILDDPSVSRVMREAGFSSTAVKNHLEDTSDYNSVASVFQCYNTSGGIYSTPNSPPNENPNLWHSGYQFQNPFLISPQKSPISLNEDIKVVLEVLMRKKRRNVVVVGDTLTMAESLVTELMGKMERGDVPEELKSAHSIKFQFTSVPLKFMKREEVEMNVSDLKRKVDSFASTGRVIIIHTGDLKWTVVDEREGGYSPVYHLVEEIGKLLSWYENSSNVKVWLMATASYQSYMKCQMKQPSLDVQWSLQAVSVPSGGLGLSLSATSGQDSRTSFLQNPSQAFDKKPFIVKEESDVLTCCQECKSNYEKEAGYNSIQQKFSSINNDTEKGSARLPFWLQSQSTPEKENLVQLRRKYNKMCQNLHQTSHHSNNFSSVITNQCNLGKNYFHTSSYPSLQNKNSFCGDSETLAFSYPATKPNQSFSSLPRFRRQQSCHIEFSFSNESPKYQSVEPNLDSLKTMDGKDVKITLALGNSEYTDDPTCQKIAANAGLCDDIRKNVPWQSETVPLIVEALMDSETIRRDKFLLIQGNDLIGKRRLAIGVAEYVFGSSDSIFSMNMRKNTNTVTQNREMLENALKNQGKLVVLIEDVDHADPEFVEFLVHCSETGKLETLSGEQSDCGRAIFILTVDSEDHTNYIMDSVMQMKFIVSKSIICDQKRKADWDLPFGTKIQRNNEMEEVTSKSIANGKKELSTHFLDLNVTANEDKYKEGKPGEFSSISSNDSTREMKTEQQNSIMFLKKIKNCFVFNRDFDHDDKATETFLSKFKTYFQEANESRNITKFDVEDLVLEEVFKGSSFYLNNLFEKWLKDVFQTSLRLVDNGDREMVSVRLCLGGGGKGETSCAEDGYMGTCLPKRIQVSFTG